MRAGGICVVLMCADPNVFCLVCVCLQASTVLGCHEQSGTYVCNLKQIVEDFRLMGHGLVETVTETATDELVV